MKMFRIILCVFIALMGIASAGCKVNLSKVAKIVGREAKQEVAQEAVTQAAKSFSGTQSANNSPDMNKNRVGGNWKSNAAKAGVAAVAGAGVAAVANEAQAYSQNVNQAKDVLVGYYLAIPDRRMREAYNALSWEMQNQLGTFETFSRGYDTTLSNDVSNIKVLSENDNAVILSYQLTSKDNINGQIKTQAFLGEATLSKIDGKWLISNFNVKLK